MNVIRVLCCLVTSFLILEVAHSSEMYLRAQEYKPPPQSEQAISLLNGTFEKSTNAVAFARLEDLRVQNGDTIIRPNDESWTTDETFSYFRYKASDPGTYVISAQTKARDVEFTRQQFAAYLNKLGRTDLIAGIADDADQSAIMERYSKHATALVQVGTDRTPLEDAQFGYPLEIILDTHPADIRFGSMVGVQLRMDGEPLANQPVRASCDGFHGHTASGDHINHYDLITDDAGKSSVLISQKCVWYVSLTAIRKSKIPDVEYESFWATTTFEVN